MTTDPNTTQDTPADSAPEGAPAQAPDSEAAPVPARDSSETEQAAAAPTSLVEEANEADTAAEDSASEAADEAPETEPAEPATPQNAAERFFTTSAEGRTSDEEVAGAVEDVFGTTPPDSDEPSVSAAEKEYQAAMEAARTLGLGAETTKNIVDQEIEAAAKLVKKLGLDEPAEDKAKTVTDPFAEKVARPSVKEVEDDDDLMGPDIDDGRSWYVLNTYSGHENRVKTNLERRIESMDVAERIFQVVVPTEEELEIRGGQRRQVQRKLLPGYVLVEMILDDDTWYVVRNTPGVTGFVGAEKPHPLPREEVKSILLQMRVVEPRVRVGFEISDTVRVMEGPFLDFMGQVDEINLDKGKVRVLISMFGRDTPVELDFMQVEKV